MPLFLAGIAHSQGSVISERLVNWSMSQDLRLIGLPAPYLVSFVGIVLGLARHGVTSEQCTKLLSDTDLSPVNASNR